MPTTTCTPIKYLHGQQVLDQQSEMDRFACDLAIFSYFCKKALLTAVSDNEVMPDEQWDDLIIESHACNLTLSIFNQCIPVIYV